MMELLIGMSANILSTYGIKRFIEIFLKNAEYRFRYPVVLYTLYWLMTCISYEFSIPTLNFCINLIGLMIVLAPYKISWGKKVIVALLVLVIYSMLDLIVVTFFVQSYFYGMDVPNVYKWLDSILLILLTVILKKIVFFKNDVELPQRFCCALMSIPLTSIILTSYMMKSNNINTKGTLILSIDLLIINILIFYLYYYLAKFYIQAKEKEVLQQMMIAYKYQLDVMQQSQNRLRALRHDLKHHILELSAIAKREHQDVIENYLKQMQDFMLNPKEYISTGNHDLDGVVNYYMRKAEEVLDKVTIDVKLPERNGEENFYLCMILGNLLDNAIEASVHSEEKYLRFSMKEKKGFLLIGLENSYLGNIKEKNGHFYTKKKHQQTHGIGIENVKKIVAMLDGEMQINYTEGRFQVHVILYIKRLANRN